jgi:hypothetical protein
MHRRGNSNLKGLEREKSSLVKTDNFGDFWFEGLKVGNYSLKIEKNGYLSQEMENISTARDINVGDITFYKTA